MFSVTPLFNKNRYILTFLLATLIAGCAVNPVTGKREFSFVSEEKEIQIGTENYVPAQQSQGGRYTVDPSVTAYVKSVGLKVAKVSDRPELPYEFVVLNNSVPNAWAMPGGKMAINRGLLTELDNEAELAAVLGHEVVHAAARHGAKALERGLLLQAGTIGLGVALADQKNSQLLVGAAAVGATLINQKYSREHELESDFYGMKYMANAGYDPGAAVTLQEKFVRLAGNREPSWLEGLFASHPPSQERVEKNKENLATFQKGGRIGRETYQQKIAQLKKDKEAYQKHDKGRKALEEGNSRLALQLASRALKAQPNEALFYGLQGEALAKLGKTNQALSSYNRAIQKDPDYFYHFLQRGLLYHKMGKRQAARNDLNASNKRMPTTPAHYALGELALAANQKTAAMKHFKVAATSESSLGKKAYKQFASLELQKMPEKYIALGLERNTDGFIHVAVKNNAPVPVNKIRIEVRLFSLQGIIKTKQIVLINGPLKPGQTRRAKTTIHLSNDELPSQSAKAAILSVTARP